MSPAVFRSATKIKGDATGGTLSYATYQGKIVRYPLVETLQEISRAAWEVFGDHKLSDSDVALRRAYSSRIAAIVVATCPDFVAKKSHYSPLTFFSDYLRIDSFFNVNVIAGELLAFTKEASVPSPVSTLQSAIAATKYFTFNRLIRSQWRTRLGHPISLMRNTWCIRNLENFLEEPIGLDEALRRRLGMRIPQFVQCSQVILLLAMQTRGQVNCNANLAGLKKWTVTTDDIKLVASKLSMDQESISLWHEEMLKKSQRGLFQHSPLPLSNAPLLFVAGEYYCTNRDGYLESVAQHLLDAVLSCPAPNSNTLNTAYGFVLEEYLVLSLRALISADAVCPVDQWENGNVKQADLFVGVGNVGLIIEQKKALASERALAVQCGADIAQIIQLIYGAYLQCCSTFDRTPWKVEPRFMSITRVSAFIVVDDAIAAEGEMVIRLIKEYTEHTLPVAVVGIDELELIVATLGVEGAETLLCERFADANNFDLPLRMYASKQLGIVPTKTHAISEFFASTQSYLYEDMFDDIPALTWP